MRYSSDNKIITIKMEEDLVASQATELKTKLLALFEKISECKEIIIDIGSVELIDSQGLNLLIGVFKESQNRGFKFRIVGSSSTNQRLFSIFKLKEMFGVL